MIYNFLLSLFLLTKLPQIFKKKFFVKERLFPHIKKSALPTIWVHAVSLGETKAAIALVEELKKEYRIIFSTTTATGFEEATKSILADEIILLPFDFSFVMRPFISQINLKAVIFVETDLWWNFIKFAKKRGAKVFAVSAKISQKSFNRFQFFSFTKILFKQIDLILSQNESYKSLFESLGSPLVKVGGNLKLAYKPKLYSSYELANWKKKLNLGDEVITIASTHFPEEEELLEVLKKVWIKRPHLQVLLAPRHPERFSEVKKYIEDEKRVILIEKMGQLPLLFQLSQLAIIGGSFGSNIGGHNVLEPLFYNIPVIFGPHMEKQEELKEIILKTSFAHSSTIHDLDAIIHNILSNRDLDRETIKFSNYNLIKTNIENITNVLLVK